MQTLGHKRLVGVRRRVPLVLVGVDEQLMYGFACVGYIHVDILLPRQRAHGQVGENDLLLEHSLDVDIGISYNYCDASCCLRCTG